MVLSSVVHIIEKKYLVFSVLSHKHKKNLVKKHKKNLGKEWS